MIFQKKMQINQICKNSHERETYHHCSFGLIFIRKTNKDKLPDKKDIIKITIFI